MKQHVWSPRSLRDALRGVTSASRADRTDIYAFLSDSRSTSTDGDWKNRHHLPPATRVLHSIASRHLPQFYARICRTLLRKMYYWRRAGMTRERDLFAYERGDGTDVASQTSVWRDHVMRDARDFDYVRRADLTTMPSTTAIAGANSGNGRPVPANTGLRPVLAFQNFIDVA